MKKKVIISSIFALTALLTVTPVIVSAETSSSKSSAKLTEVNDITTSNSIVGGWSEDEGMYVNNLYGNLMLRSSPHHTGQAETKTINGTGHKRAHGWTTWPGIKHYTTARLEQGSYVNGTSGRVWGTGGTEAASPWKPYTTSGDPGRARTYYGR
ncbi:hypothetical protein [Lactococcus lactis]|uniref:hypothetical protein n=1 Tax=Lactococcus lactis TaxID=1358 RepID=UPI003D286EF8